MIFLLYGPDNYSSREKVREMVEHYKEIHKSGLDFKYLDGKNLDFSELLNEDQQSSIFNEKKLIVVTNVVSNKEFKEKFIKGYKKLIDSSNIIVFLEEDKIATNDSILKILKKHAKCQEFPILSGEKMKRWVKNELSKFKGDISTNALDKLLEYCEGNLWSLSNEIKKLGAFKIGKTIEINDVELLVKPKIETDIFKTIDAIASKDRKSALLLLHKHLDKGDSPLYLLSMINFQFRNLLLVKDLMEKGKSYYDIPKLTKLHSFVVKKSYQSAQRFQYQELQKIYQKIFQVDLSIKTGKLKPEIALDIFIAEI
ncbi:MAG: DNA polymerase III subunit delta [Candidatus Nealsonbacteria bacterium]